MANEIQADPAKIRQIADGIGGVYTSLRNSLYESSGQVSSLKGIWSGTAAEAFNASFQTLIDKCAQSLEIVGRLENALYESADAYERSEKSIEQEASNMPKLPENTMR
ncbi:MAG: WXG100 family type VII secretion target [Syntrophomonadaceae bacterium]|nr:WXG100 family type VII secretion target [Syntrophomonadaceae bacterium]